MVVDPDRDRDLVVVIYNGKRYFNCPVNLLPQTLSAHPPVYLSAYPVYKINTQLKFHYDNFLLNWRFNEQGKK